MLFWASGRGRPCRETPRGAGSCGWHCQPLLPLTAAAQTTTFIPVCCFCPSISSASDGKWIFSTLFLCSLHFSSTSVSVNVRRRDETLPLFLLQLRERLFPSLHICALILLIWLLGFFVVVVLHFTYLFPLLEGWYLLILFLPVPVFWLYFSHCISWFFPFIF